ncbi:MAG: hypothetical protein JWN48_5059 [Myxococcaceae bacterium]|nr:hypothetical protein [Myxococcaceae bacterium]
MKELNRSERGLAEHGDEGAAFHLLVESLQDCALYILDPKGVVATWNLGAARIKGYQPAEIVGRHFSAFYTPEDIAANTPERALATARSANRYAEEGWRVRKDGSRFWASVVITPLRDQRGNLVGFGKMTRDLTDFQRAVEEASCDQSFMFELGEALRLLEEPEVLLSMLVERTAAYLQVSRCVFSDIDASGELVRYHRDYFRPGLCSLSGTYPISSFGSVVDDLRAGRAVTYSDARLDPRTAAQFEAAYRPIGVIASIAMPLLEDGQFKAALFVSSETPRQWSTREILLLQKVAERGWHWFQRLTERQQRERERAEAVRDQKFLADLSETMRSTDDADDVVRRTAMQLVAYLRVADCQVSAVHIAAPADPTRIEDHVAAPWNASLQPFSYVSAETQSALKDSETVVVHDASTDARTACVFDDHYRERAVQAFIHVPLLRAQGLRWSFTVISEVARSWQARELALVQAVAEKLWHVLKDLGDRHQLEKQREESARDQTFLFELGESLRPIETPEDVLLCSATRVAQYLQLSRCWINHVDLERREFVATHDYHGELPSIAGRYPFASFSPLSIEDFRAGRSVINHDVRSNPRTASLFCKSYQPLGMSASATVPMFEDGRWKASLAAVSDVPRRWTAREVSLLQAVAEKTWLWFRRLQERAQVEQQRAHAAGDQKFLFELGEVVRLGDEPDAILASATRRLAEYLGLSRCIFNHVDLARDELVNRHGYNGELPPIAGPYKVSSFSAHSIADFTAGRTVINHDLATDPRTSPTFEVRYRPLGMFATVTVPLLEDGQWIAMFMAISATPRMWTEREVALVQQTAEKTWLWVKHAIGRARAAADREEAANDQRFLFELGESLRVTNEVDELLLRGATLLARHLHLSRCSFSEVDLVGNELVTQRDYHGELSSVVGKRPLTSFNPQSLAELSAGRSVINNDTSTDPRTAQLFESTYRPLGVFANVAMPLLENGQWRATLVAVSGAPRAWTQREVTLVQTVGEKTWLWAKHVKDSIRIDEERKTALRDQTFLFDLGEAARSAESKDELVARVLADTAGYLRVARCMVSEVDLAAGEYRVRGDVHGELASMAGTHPLTNVSEETLQELKEQRTLVIDDVRSHPQTASRFEARYRALRIFALAAVPLVRDLELKSTLSVTSDVPRAWQPREVSLLQAVAEKLWLWLKHVEMLEALRESERRLKALAASLETRVEERTRDLVASEAQLTAVMADLSRSNGELQQFAYVASHDLRAPLRAIDSLSSWIEEDLQGVLTGETGEHMRLLRGRVQRMEQLLADLLEYAQAGRDPKSTEKVATEDVLFEIRQLINAPKGIVVETDGPMPVLETPKLPLTRVLLNLVSNAVKHHDRPVGAVKVAARDAGEYWEFSVADDGPGIPARFHQKAFQMFQTLKSRDEVEGSGMGLALVKKLVESAGCHIRLESTGRGATFRFTWPKVWSIQGGKLDTGALRRHLPESGHGNPAA